MQLGLYEWVYIVTNVFWTYTIFKYMDAFFDSKKTSRIVELSIYAAYYILLTVLYIFVNIPIILMISNLAAFVILTYNYESTIKKRILSAFFIYLILFCVEMTLVVFSGYFNFQIFSTNNYSSVFWLITCRIISYIVVLILNNFKHIRKGEYVPNSYWFCIVIIPASSLYITVLLFQANGISSTEVMLCLILLFLINFSVFYLYDVITAALFDKMQSLMIIEQNKYYGRQLETIKSSLQTTNAIRHDLKNHMFSIRALIESDDSVGSLNYISKIMDDIGTRKDYSASGNTVIDSIINFKFQEAEQLGIKTSLDLRIPGNLDMPSFDITVILGNLLDNAIKAALEVEENPFINLKMLYDKGRLMIQLDNPYIGEIKAENGKLLTTSKDKENHGYGIQNIKKVIEKYDGTMDIDYENNIFSVTLFMYVN